MQRLLQDKTRNVKSVGIGVSYIRGLTVVMPYHQWSRASTAQVMACCLFGITLKPMPTTNQVSHPQQTPVTFEMDIFIQKYTKCPPFFFKSCWGVTVCTVLTLYELNFQRKHKHVFTFHVISPHWHAIDSWNPSSCKTRTYLFYI